MSKSHKQDKVNAALGECVIAFQSLEHDLINLFSCLNSKNNPTIGIIISAKLSFNTLLDVLDAVFRFRVNDTALIKKFAHIIKESEKFQKERNACVHSHYECNFLCADEISFSQINKKISRGKGYITRHKEYDPDALIELSREIYSLILEISSLADNLQRQGYIDDVYGQLS